MPERLQPEEFINVDVMTCAAPHVFPNVRISDDDLLAMHIKRAKNILRVAAYNGVDILITGAFGCGAFHSPAEIVARAWHEALKDYREKFDLIDFVIYVSDYEPKRPGGERNLSIFTKEFCSNNNKEESHMPFVERRPRENVSGHIELLRGGRDITRGSQ